MRALLGLLVVSTAALAQVEGDAGVASVVDAATAPTVALEARLAELERRLADEQQQRASSVSALEQGVAFLKRLPAVVSATGVKLTLTGFVQADG
jgi:hypothetical protein